MQSIWGVEFISGKTFPIDGIYDWNRKKIPPEEALQQLASCGFNISEIAENLAMIVKQGGVGDVEAIILCRGLFYRGGINIKYLPSD